MVLHKILVMAGLQERNLQTILSPILKIKDVEVVVIRSYPGVPQEHLTYLCPPRIFRKSTLLTLIWKILVTVRLGLEARFTCVLAVFSYPHLYLAFLASILSKKPLLQRVIASCQEFTWHGPMIEKLTVRVSKRASIIFISDQKTAQYLIRQGIPASKFVKYRRIDSVDLTHFFPMGLEKPVDLIVVTRLSPEKHVETFIDIVNSLRSSFPDIRASIVGDGMMRRSLEEYVHHLDLAENIEFHGWVSSPVTLNQLLNSAKIFVLNSSHEGGPLTAMEAMAAGLCCVCSNVGEIPWIITNESNGFIVERHYDVKTYANIITKLLKDPENLKEMQKRASQIAKKKNPYAQTQLWEKLLNIFSNSA